MMEVGTTLTLGCNTDKQWFRSGTNLHWISIWLTPWSGSTFRLESGSSRSEKSSNSENLWLLFPLHFYLALFHLLGLYYSSYFYLFWLFCRINTCAEAIYSDQESPGLFQLIGQLETAVDKILERQVQQFMVNNKNKKPLYSSATVIHICSHFIRLQIQIFH
jgi:hypothetical protein